ncbi:MAG: iron-sulfur cluster carrier protein ApbC [Gammaproteobacteria bacterium]|nr:iron-sulfur cluster carrier protein ApbC [Gammaproteobacteria bacterium]
MTMIKQSEIEARLNQYAYPRAKQTITITGAQVDITLVFGFPVKTIRQQIINEISQLLDVFPIEKLTLSINSKIAAHTTQLVNQSIPNVKNIIAVASGKGGVGKSTTSVNLALALAQMGARVGLLDADIYGPNVPQMLGTQAQQATSKNKKFNPIDAHGIQTISLAHLVDVNAPIAWRGPMISKVLQQLLQDTLWQDLDYLIIDLPPGTGDIQLTLGSKVPVSAAVIVTTPQDVALLDAKRGIEMFNKVNIKVLGIVENMAQHICSHCGHQEAIFGEQGGKNIAQDYGVPLLGQLPLDRQIRVDCDAGLPSVVANPESAVARSYQRIALQLAVELAQRDVDYSRKFSKISVISS